MRGLRRPATPAPGPRPVTLARRPRPAIPARGPHPDRAFGFNQATLLALVVALSPTDIIVLQGGATVYLTELMLWAVCGAYLFVSILSERRDALSQLVYEMPAAAVYLIWIALAALLAVGLDGAPDQIGKVKNTLPGLLLAAAVLHTVRTRAALRMVVLALMAGAALNGAMALTQMALGGPYPVPPGEGAIWKERLDGGIVEVLTIGFFGTANALGNALLLPIVLGSAIILLGAGFSPLARVFVAVCLALAVGGLVLSAHKGAIAWAVIGVAIALWPLGHRGAIALVAVIGGVAALLGVSLLSTLGDVPGADTVMVRIGLMEAFLWQVAERPEILLYGNGTDGMLYMASLLANWPFGATHNTWLDQVLFFGLPGLLLYGLAWVSALGRLAAAERTAGAGDAPVMAMLLGAAASFAGSIFFEPRADGAFAIAQILLLLALCVAACRIMGRTAPAGPDYSRIGHQGVAG